MGPAASELSLAVSLALDGLELDCLLKAIFCSWSCKLVKLQSHKRVLKRIAEMLKPVRLSAIADRLHGFVATT